jgi:hypothetical protein
MDGSLVRMEIPMGSLLRTRSLFRRKAVQADSPEAATNDSTSI